MILQELLAGLWVGAIVVGLTLIVILLFDLLVFFRWWHSSQLEASGARAFFWFCIVFLVQLTRLESLAQQTLRQTQELAAYTFGLGLVTAHGLYWYFNYADKALFRIWLKQHERHRLLVAKRMAVKRSSSSRSGK